MPATAPNPKKAATPKSGPAAKPAKPAAKASTEKPAKKNSNFIPNFFRGKITLSDDFFDEHERPENWPSKPAAAPKTGAVGKSAAKPAAPKPAKKNSNFIPNFWKDKIIVHPDFFEPHEQPENLFNGE